MQNCLQVKRHIFVVQGIATSTEELNNDLRNISKSAYQWKITFNPELTK